MGIDGEVRLEHFVTTSSLDGVTGLYGDCGAIVAVLAVACHQMGGITRKQASCKNCFFDDNCDAT